MTAGELADSTAKPEEDLATMTFAEHLDELRRRLFVSLIAVFGVMFFFLFQHDRVMGFVSGPYKDMWRSSAEVWKAKRFDRIDPATLGPAYKEDYGLVRDNWDAILGMRWDDIAGGAVNIPLAMERFGFKLNPRLISTTPLQDIVTFMVAALLCGIAVASPIVLHQIWRFIAAGLYKRERRIVMRYLPAAILLFAGGMTFGYVVMVPTALYFLYGLATTEFLLTIRDYFRFLFVLTIALGFVFQLPVVMVALTNVGVTTPQTYLKHWRYVILGLFVVGALFTPPDPITQVLMAGPMILLFLVGVGLSALVYRKRQEAQRAADSESAPE